MQALDQGRHLGKGEIAHFVEPTIESRDQLFLIRMHRLQAMCRLSWVAAVVLRRMPLACGHFGEETLHLRGVGKELAIEVPGVPIDQDSTEVEHGDRGVWRACL